MINTLVTLLCVVVFFLLGQITQAFKKLLSLVTKLFLKIFNLFGIKWSQKEKHIRLSNDFKETYKDIKVVKLSKKNIKQQSSIDWVGLVVLIITILLFIINIKDISGNIISNWLYSLLSEIPVIKIMFSSAEATNTLFIAVSFSIISYCACRIKYRWKETKQQRKEAREARIKCKAIELMDSKDLLDAAKIKDIEAEKEFK